ncbi:MAG: TonB-dependent receptor [Gemmatimonadota bacterium]
MIFPLLLAILHGSAGSSLSGIVRSSDSASAPIASALVEVRGAGADPSLRASTDSLGHYELSGLPAGSYHLRVSRMGYDPRELDVLVATVPRVVVDIVLVPRPQLLSELQVRARAQRDSALRSRALPFDSTGFEAITIAGPSLHEDPALAAADALESFNSYGLASSRHETPTSIHVRGGGAAETGITVDGIPVFNPYHALGTLTALNPDVISAASLDRGAPSAASGGATSSTIALTTTPADAQRIETRGAFNSRSLRETVGAPLPIASSTLLVAVRHSLRASLSESPSGSVGGSDFGDMFAKFTMPLRGGELEAFAFHSTDHLSFAATPDDIAAHANGREQPDREHDAAAAPSVQPLVNALGWRTGTDAVRWHSDSEMRWNVRAWRTRFDADFEWAGTSQLRNSLVDLGAGVGNSWTIGGAQFESGVSADRYDVRYDVARTDSSMLSPLALRGAPTLVSAFGEARWKVATQWSFVAGIRDALVAPAHAGIEPRLSVRFSPSGLLSFGIGYARMHQFVQSLRNEESLFDAVAGISLPVIAGSSFGGGVVPAAQADQLTATADARLSHSLTLSANAYARNVSGLTLAAPVTGEPFATTSFATGSARARGLSVALSREGERLTGQLTYSLAGVTQRANGSSYTPSFSAAQSLAGAANFRVWANTVLRVAASVHSGAPTSVIADQVEWSPYSSAAGQGDLAGSPGRIAGALDGSRLPAYARFDVGVRRDWRLRVFGRESEVTTSASLSNLFDRGNTLGVLASQASPGAFLLLPRRSATFGLNWKY